MSQLIDRVRRSLNAIQRDEESLRAWAHVNAERALDHAYLIEDMLSQGLDLPVGGMTIGVKDIVNVAGMPTSAGFAPWVENVAQDDAAVIRRLRRAGVVIMGKTVTTQFAASDPAETRNPWNLDCTPGGSSSGSAVAVAAQHVDVALGTQTAGSILRPAAYCGVIGFKPTFGAIPTDGMLAYAPSFDTLGMLARSVADIFRVYFASIDAQPDAPIEQSLPSPRIGIWADALAHAGESMRDAVIDAIEQLAQSGAQVFDAICPLAFDNAVAIHRTIVRPEAAIVHAENLACHPEHYGPKLRATIEVGSVIPASAYAKAQFLRNEYRAMIERHWSSFDLIAIPTTSTTAPTRDTTGDHDLQAFASLFGFPALTIPIGFDRDQLPIGLQLIAPRRGADEHLLRHALWVEQFMPQMPLPPYASEPGE